MAGQDFFIWGAGNEKVTPAELARRREFENKLVQKGVDISPVQHWTQGLSRVADAAAGAFRRGRLGRMEAENAKVNENLIANLLAGGGTSTPSSGTSVPMPGAAAEISTTSPGTIGNVDPSIRDGIVQTASALGIDPVDLATAISYETAGTFDPTKSGPTTQWGQHRGLIQFGEPQAKEYGVNWEDPIGSQLGENGAVANYLRATGVQPGMGLMDIYSAINAGGVGRYGASDANNGGAPGTVADKVNNQMAGHRAKALALLGTGQPADAAQAIEAVAPEAAGEIAMQPAAAAQPVQVAGGGDRVPMASASTGINPAIIEALTNPQASEQTQRIAGILLQQEQARQNAAMDEQNWRARQAYEQELLASDPLRKLQIQKAQQELDRGQPLINLGDGTAYDPNTRQFIKDPNATGKPPNLVELFDEKTGQPYKAQWNPQTKQFDRVGGMKAPSGTSLTVGPNGEVQFTQGGAKLTEAQSKDAFFTTRMTAATPTIDKFESSLMSLPEAAAGAIPMNLGRYAQSEEYQLAKDAGRDFVNAYLRKDSGAALTKQEEQNYGELLLPQPGDKPAILAAKRQRRAIAVEAIKSGMPAAALDGVIRAIQAVPGADQPAKTTDEIPTDIPGVKIRRKN